MQAWAPLRQIRVVMTPNSSNSPSRHPHLKLIRATALPAFSVVMSTVCEEGHLPALRSVAARCKELGAELVVARPRGVTYDGLRDEWNVRFVPVPADATPSDVRRVAVAHATGDIALVLDWSALEEEGWSDRIGGYEANARTAAGSDKRRENAVVDWAEFLSVRGVVPPNPVGALQPARPTLAPKAARARSALMRWTEHFASVDRVRPARP